MVPQTSLEECSGSRGEVFGVPEKAAQADERVGVLLRVPQLHGLCFEVCVGALIIRSRLWCELLTFAVGGSAQRGLPRNGLVVHLPPLPCLLHLGTGHSVL